jgi:hypothetical protein
MTEEEADRLMRDEPVFVTHWFAGNTPGVRKCLHKHKATDKLVQGTGKPNVCGWKLDDGSIVPAHSMHRTHEQARAHIAKMIREKINNLEALLSRWENAENPTS